MAQGQRPRTPAPRPARFLALVLTTLSLLAFLAGPGAGAAHAKKQVSKLKRGLTLTRITYPKGPFRLRVLTVTDPGKHAVTVDIGMPGGSYPGLLPTGRVGDSYHALGAINGDFASSGRPVHPSVEDGDLRSSGLARGVAFAMSGDEKRGFAKRPGMRITASSNNPQVPNFSIDRWNAGGAGGGNVAAFTPVGGSIEKPGSDVCSAKLLPLDGADGRKIWDAAHAGVTRTYSVESQPQPCPNSAPNLPDGPSVVITATRDTPRGDIIKQLEGNDEVTIKWDVGWKGALDMIGGNPQLLADRDNNGRAKVVAPAHCGSYFCNKNPRTGVGVNRKCINGNDGCKVFLMVVDGRRPGWSVGMTLPRFAAEFKRLGATWAINLDGGGGTTMWTSNRGKYCQRRTGYGGCILNRPSDPSGDRPTSSAVMVIPTRDEAEPAQTLAPVSITSVDPAATTLAGLAALEDPGSTGGLFDALLSGRLGPRPDTLATEVRLGAQTYRAARARG